ncbi:hypothetical protein KM043_011516 [Ampulex compressa]|nr:hypothetical protein KM043_011516 [Ampulex compressa]
MERGGRKHRREPRFGRKGELVYGGKGEREKENGEGRWRERGKEGEGAHRGRKVAPPRCDSDNTCPTVARAGQERRTANVVPETEILKPPFALLRASNDRWRIEGNWVNPGSCDTAIRKLIGEARGSLPRPSEFQDGEYSHSGLTRRRGEAARGEESGREWSHGAYECDVLNLGVVHALPDKSGYFQPRINSVPFGKLYKPLD